MNKKAYYAPKADVIERTDIILLSGDTTETIEPSFAKDTYDWL